MAKKPDTIQPEINIGTVGHVDHGKTTLVQAITGKWADTHSEEIKRGITIRLGYADGVFRKCPKCKGVKAYTHEEKCKEHKVKTKILRKVSFVDAPGHESLMATMFAGATIMDGAMMLIAANEKCPQPQTREHLMALEISGLKNIVIVQNKIDLVSEEEAIKNYNQIKEFIKGTSFENAPIIPVSAQKRINIDALIMALEENLPTPKRDDKKDPIMFVARSFDINKPGSNPQKMIGGVLGGAIVQGKIKEGQEIEIKPGYKVEKDGHVSWQSFTTKVVGLRTGGEKVKELIPGGNVGVLTSLDPAFVKSDQLAGSVVGEKGKLPPTRYNVKLETHLLDKVVGAKEDLVVEPIKLSEPLMLNVNSAVTVGVVTELSKGIISCKLKLPVCAAVGSRVTISRRISNRFRLIGYGMIKE